MAKSTKKPSKVERELTATVEKLRARLATTEAKAEKWKSQAKDAEKAVGGLEKKLVRATRRADKAKQKSKADKAARKVVEAAVEQNAQDLSDLAQERAEEQAQVAAAGDADQAPEPTSPAVPASEQVPDESWTVTRLREAARNQGMTGFSRKSKAQLLASLR